MVGMSVYLDFLPTVEIRSPAIAPPLLAIEISLKSCRLHMFQIYVSGAGRNMLNMLPQCWQAKELTAISCWERDSYIHVVGVGGKGAGQTTTNYNYDDTNWLCFCMCVCVCCSVFALPWSWFYLFIYIFFSFFSFFLGFLTTQNVRILRQGIRGMWGLSSFHWHSVGSLSIWTFSRLTPKRIKTKS